MAPSHLSLSSDVGTSLCCLGYPACCRPNGRYTSASSCSHSAEATGNIEPPRLGQNAFPNQTHKSGDTHSSEECCAHNSSIDCATHLHTASAACFCLLKVRRSIGLLWMRSQANEPHPGCDSCTADSGQQDGFFGSAKTPCHSSGFRARSSSPRFLDSYTTSTAA